MSDDDAIRAVVALRAAKWKFIHLRDPDGGAEVVGIVAYREWPYEAMDLVRIVEAGDSLGSRMTVEDKPRLCFERTGALPEVVQAMLELPPPDHPSAPRPTSKAGPMPPDAGERQGYAV